VITEAGAAPPLRGIGWVHRQRCCAIPEARDVVNASPPRPPRRQHVGRVRDVGAIFRVSHSCLYDGVVVISIGAVCMATPVVQRLVDTVAGGVPSRYLPKPATPSKPSETIGG